MSCERLMVLFTLSSRVMESLYNIYNMPTIHSAVIESSIILDQNPILDEMPCRKKQCHCCHILAMRNA
jgi:hypothetical protein